MANIFDDNSEFKKYIKPKPVDKKPVDAKPVEDAKTKLEISPNMQPRALNKSAAKSAFQLDLSNKTLKPHYVAVAKEDLEKKETFAIPKIKFENLETPASSDSQPTKQEGKANAGHSTMPKQSKFAQIFFDNLKTILYGGIIFLVGYLALNFGAYLEIGTNLYYELTGQERNPVLQTFTDNQSIESLVTEAGSEAIISSVPAFDMEITPPGTRIIIPRLGKNVPVINISDDNLIKRDWGALEKDLQQGLRNGVVHYPGTPWPGQSGNVVITGHSSYYPWDPGRFKDVFAVLHNVNIGDEIIVFHNQRKYRYKVSNTKVVLPQEVQVLGDTGDNRITLLTCTPIGTNLKRLIVTALPVEST